MFQTIPHKVRHDAGRYTIPVQPIGLLYKTMKLKRLTVFTCTFERTPLPVHGMKPNKRRLLYLSEIKAEHWEGRACAHCTLVIKAERLPIWGISYFTGWITSQPTDEEMSMIKFYFPYHIGIRELESNSEDYSVLEFTINLERKSFSDTLIEFFALLKRRTMPYGELKVETSAMHQKSFVIPDDGSDFYPSYSSHLLLRAGFQRVSV